MPIEPLDPVPGPYKNPDDHAVVVGIDHYGANIKKLEGAINDCRLFCRWLVGPTMGGLNPANVKLWISNNQPPPEEPIRSNIENILADYFDDFNEGWAGGRRLYLFFAGHGLSPPPPNQLDCGLVMADARLNLLRGLVGGKAANGMRLSGMFKEVMLVMDCCAEVAGRAELSCYLPSDGDVTLAGRPYVHIHAAAVNATTAEKLLPDPLDPAKPHSWQGVLTHTLLRGLTTASDAAGQITGGSLKSFIEAAAAGGPRVEVSEGDQAAPTPMIFGMSNGVKVNVTLSNGAGHFQVRDGNFNVAVQPQPAPATVTLKPGIWLFDSLNVAGAFVASKMVTVIEGGTDVVI